MAQLTASEGLVVWCALGLLRFQLSLLGLALGLQRCQAHAMSYHTMPYLQRCQALLGCLQLKITRLHYLRRWEGSP